MRALWFLLLGACSIPDKVLIDGGAGSADASTIDGVPRDAQPLDAALRYPCLGQPLPTTAANTVHLTGATRGLGSEGLLPNAAITVLGDNNEAVFAAQSDTNGNYSIPLSTGGAPQDDYMHSTYNGHVDTYLYPGVPYVADDMADIILATPTTIAQAASFAGTTYNTGKAQLLVTVVDCDGAPVEGATLTTAPAGEVFPLRNGLPAQGQTTSDASGQFVVFNVGVDAGTIAVRGHVTEGNFRVETIHGPQPGAISIIRSHP